MESLNQDEKLIRRLTEIVLKNLTNEQFGVQDLSEESGMSRSNLHRKLKVLKGNSVSQFIRQIRLNEAMKLLQQNAASSSEIHQALQELANLLVRRSDSSYVAPWQIGTLYTRAGDKEHALYWLEKALEAHDSNIPYLEIDPIFKILYNEPRFEQLLEQAGLTNRAES